MSSSGGFSPRASAGRTPIPGSSNAVGPSMSAERSARRTAASPSLAVSSTRMSWSVDPSGASSRLASSRVASAWPAPSRSTAVVAAVYDAKPSDISTSLAGDEARHRSARRFRRGRR